MPVTVVFENIDTKKSVSVPYQRGAVIPKDGSHIASPFTEGKIARVTEIIGSDAVSPLHMYAFDLPE